MTFVPARKRNWTPPAKEVVNCVGYPFFLRDKNKELQFFDFEEENKAFVDEKSTEGPPFIGPVSVDSGQSYKVTLYRISLEHIHIPSPRPGVWFIVPGEVARHPKAGRRADLLALPLYYKAMHKSPRGEDSVEYPVYDELQYVLAPLPEYDSRPDLVYTFDGKA